LRPPQVVGGRVRDEARGAACDLLDHGEPVCAQSGPGRHEVDDPVGQSDQWRHFGRSRDLHDLHRDAARAEMPLGDVRVFGRDIESAEVAIFVERSFHSVTWRRDDEPARAESELDELDDSRPALEENVLSDDREVGGAALDVGRDVAGPGKDKLNIATGDNEAPAAGRDAGHVEADRAQSGECVVQEETLREREPKRPHDATSLPREAASATRPSSSFTRLSSITSAWMTARPARSTTSPSATASPP